MNFEITYIAHNPAVFEKHLGPSLRNLSGNFVTTAIPNGSKPASAFNKVIRESKCDFIIFTHEDVCFSSNFLERVEYTIKTVPDFGVLGMVGRDKFGNYCWPNRGCSYIVTTLDCCLAIIRRDMGLLFDDETFDDYHLYIEDYCMRMKRDFGRGSFTLLMNMIPDDKFPDFIAHQGVTIRKDGKCWGNYYKYRKILQDRHPDVITT